MALFLRPFRAARIKTTVRHGLRGVRLTAGLLHPRLQSLTPLGVGKQPPEMSRTCRALPG